MFTTKPDCYENALNRLKIIANNNEWFGLYIKNISEKDFTCDHHHCIGRQMRNYWGLWNGGKLQRWFITKGIYHADDMSDILLTTFYRRQKGIPEEFDKQVKLYQDYWKKIN